MTVQIGPQAAATLDEQFSAASLTERLVLVARMARRAVFTTSLGVEDQVITDAIGSSALRISIATLQTGRLFGETLALLDDTRSRYGVEIEEFHPEQSDIDAYKSKYGINGFYESVEARHACCGFRKLKPLARALEGADFWITGLRREQSSNRGQTPFAEWDDERGLIKVNPLVDWSLDQVNSYVAKHHVPVNPLHARGYPSIGCEPCTRAIKPGEDERAGRWWWENDEKRECGLHVPEASAVPAA